MEKRCLNCNKDISNLHGNAKFCKECSHLCHSIQSEEWRKKMVGRHRCKTCGAPVSTQRKSQSPTQCFACHIKTMPKRDKSPTWKGGRIKCNGYIYLAYDFPHNWTRKHSKNGMPYIPEHVLNWEKANRQLLPKTHVIHHLNGIKDDNRPENLVAMVKHSHSSNLLNRELQKHIRYLESLLSKRAVST